MQKTKFVDVEHHRFVYRDDTLHLEVRLAEDELAPERFHVWGTDSRGGNPGHNGQGFSVGFDTMDEAVEHYQEVRAVFAATALSRLS